MIGATLPTNATVGHLRVLSMIENLLQTYGKGTMSEALQSQLADDELGDTGSFNKDLWPFRVDGQLPEAIFTSEHIDHIIFELWPLAFKCSLNTIRGGLRSQIKKFAPLPIKKQDAGQVEQAKSLANQFASNNICRAKSRELTFIIEQPNHKFGRQGKNTKILEPKKTFGELIGQAYCFDTQTEALFDWFLKVAQPKKKGQSERYLTAALLKSGYTDECPADPKSIEFARMVLIYASVLDNIEDQAELLQAARELGSAHLNEMLCENYVTQSRRTATNEETDVHDVPHANKKTTVPTLDLISKTGMVWRADSQTTSLTDALRQAQNSHETALDIAKTWHGDNAAALVSLTDEKWSSALATIQLARNTYKELTKTRGILADQETQLLKDIDNLLQLEAPLETLYHCDDANLISSTLEINSLKCAIEELNPSFYQLSNWCQRNKDNLSRAALRELVNSCEIDRLNKQARDQYRLDFDLYAEERETDTISTLLPILNGEELGALITTQNDHIWGVGEAILLTASIKKAGYVSNAILEPLIHASSINRRLLLSFLNPENTVARSSIALRRILAVERFRTVVYFEPIAQILDLTSSLTSVEVIGRNVYELSELLCTNATILGSSADISRLIRQAQHDGDALNALLAFVKMPVTMQGNYRRLKEKAREALETQVFSTDEINNKNIINFLHDIENGELAREIISRLCAERPDDKIEQRHKEQLTRYIAQIETLLRDCVSEAQHRPDARLKSLAAKIRRMHRQLRSSDDVGSIEWLEGQIADILGKPSRETSFQYPKSLWDCDLESIWPDEATDFASQHVDLPEFYYSNPIYFRDVAASIVYWRGQSRQPSSLEIAEILVNTGHIADAIQFSKERNDTAVHDFILEITAPIFEKIKERADTIKDLYGASLIERMEEYCSYNSALLSLDIHAASDALDLVELIASEPIATENEKNNNSRHLDLQKRLLKFESVKLDSNPTLAALEQHWAAILLSNAQKRAHLITVEKLYDSVEFLPSNLKHLLTTFKAENEAPERWLNEEVSLEFSEYAREASERLAVWAKSAHIMIPEEKNATYVICEWFLSFIVERALSMHQLDEAEGLGSAMDRIFEISATIVNAGSPGECAIQLMDTGELPEEFADAIDSVAYGETEGTRTRRVLEEHPVLIGAESIAHLSELIRLESWKEALALHNELNPTADEHNLKGVFLALSDRLPKPNTSAIDHLQSAAAWLSGSHELVVQLSESQRLSMAFHVLSGAIAADSNEDMPRTPSSNGGWAEILGRSSAFRKMLLSLVPFRVERVLETFLAGNLSIAVADRLWDAATNINDPHLLRTPILSFMYEHGAAEAICRLAARHDSAIATRLSQLFELRAVASARPDLIPVAQSVADQIVSAAKSVPFRNFVKELPTAAHAVKPNLAVDSEGDLFLHDSQRNAVFELPIVVTPNGLVPTKLEASLFEGDDVYFEDNLLRCELSNRPIYFASDFTLRIRFGGSWFSRGKSKDGVRIRIRAKTLTDDLFSEDIVFRARSVDPKIYNGARLSTDTLLDLYPGVSNTPAVEDTFIGRHDELELLNQVLVSARRPSPVLLTGMRRIGKTSLLFAFHKRLRQPGNATALTFYISLAERRVEFVAHQRPVSATLFRAISHGLVRPNLSITDQNYALCSRIRQRFDGDWKMARNSIQECYDEESLSDSLIALSAKLIEWVGAPLERFVLLIDEAEALVAPYQAGGVKKLELEQLLQSLREVSQTTGSIGILLAGSNHINIFAREYKNAFFGSSQSIELTGLKDAREAAALIAPKRVSAFIQFDPTAIEYAFSLCAGMPQFLWQVGATVAHLVRIGSATKRDVRLAIAALIGDNKSELPFKAYEILEPIDSILSLESLKERDLLWMLLYRIANASSLVAEDATIPFVIDHALASLDERSSWNRRLRSLVDLKILRMESASTIRFQVPLFGEGFRAKKHWQEYNARLQGVAQ
jgi:hypothetical protein